MVCHAALFCEISADFVDRSWLVTIKGKRPIANDSSSRELPGHAICARCTSDSAAPARMRSSHMRTSQVPQPNGLRRDRFCSREHRAASRELGDAIARRCFFHLAGGLVRSVHGAKLCRSPSITLLFMRTIRSRPRGFSPNCWDSHRLGN